MHDGKSLDFNHRSPNSAIKVTGSHRNVIIREESGDCRRSIGSQRAHYARARTYQMDSDLIEVDEAEVSQS